MPPAKFLSEVDNASEYRYKSLEGPLSIRLLTLQPGAPDEPIRCSLNHTDLKSHISYTALSYAWGDVLDRRQIQVDGKTLLITKNLHSALYRLRAIGRRIIWADAICIDQSTEPHALRDREFQVQLMGSIFAQAERVIVDLGEANEDFEPALNLSNMIWGKRDYFEKLHPTYSMQPQDREESGLPGREDDIWLSWTRFLGRPWFQRVWVIQEFALAQKVRFLCGTVQFHPTILTYSSKIINSHALWNINQISSTVLEAEFREAYHGMAGLLRMMIIRSRFKQGETQNLTELMMINRAFKAADPRDKVYALLGLATDVDTSTFKLDYSEPYTTTFERAARFLIEGGEAMAVLYQAGRPTKDLPSWVPDFRIQIESGQLGASFSSKEDRSLIRASGDTTSDAHVAPDAGLLDLSGFCFDEIEGLTSVFTPHLVQGGILADLQNLANWVEEALDVISQRRVISPYPSILDAFWGTIFTADLSNKVARAMQSRFKLFEDSQQFMELMEMIRTRSVPHPLAGLGFALLETDKPFETFLTVSKSLPDHRLCVTRKGYLGLVSDVTAVGDIISVFHGGDVPFVIRKAEEHHLLIGTCYVHGIMSGEAVTSGDYKIQQIVLQ
jgi:hypothetical protein